METDLLRIVDILVLVLHPRVRIAFVLLLFSYKQPRVVVRSSDMSSGPSLPVTLA